MKLHLSLCNLITKASRVVVRQYQQELVTYGITPSQGGIVYILSLVGPSSQMEIAQRLHLDKTNVNAMVKKLTDRGLVSMVKDSGDARKTIIALTPEGGELAKILVEVDRKMGEVYLQRAGSAEEAAVIRRFLEGVVFEE